jgi:hypothetical protein
LTTRADAAVLQRGNALAFSRQLELRRERWRTRGVWRGWSSLWHRVGEVRTIRRRDDPDEVWRCCDHWQRTLANKWNSREFAAKHGCAVPELYWAGSALESAPLESLPSHFVIRSVSGAARHGVAVMAHGVDILRNQPMSPADLRQRFAARTTFGPRIQVLAEEFVRTEDGADLLPVEYKCHAFCGVIAAVQVIVRTAAKQAKHRYYTPAWEPFPDRMGTALAEDAVRTPPRCLAEMLRAASTLGSAFGSYVRVDFFATDRGAVFNEFSAMPAGGRKFTPYCEQLFGALWSEHCGNDQHPHR